MISLLVAIVFAAVIAWVCSWFLPGVVCALIFVVVVLVALSGWRGRL